MEQNIKRSEKVTKKYRDDWVDEKGYLHTKITKEIITGPIDNVQASRGIEEPLLQRVMRPLMNRPRMMMRRQDLPQQPIQPQQVQPKPQIDINALMTIGKKLLDESGIDFKDLLSKAIKPEILEDKSDDLTDEKEVDDKKWQKTIKKQKPQKNQLKIKKTKIQTKTQNKKD